MAALLILAAFPQVWFFGHSLVATDQYNPLQNDYSVAVKGSDFVPAEEWTKRGLIDLPNLHDPDSEWWQGEPSLIFFRRAVLGGEFPFWDPSAGAGAPAFTSMVPSFLFPPQIALSLAGATSWQKNAYIFLFFWAATWGTYCLLRLHGINRTGSTAGAVVFLFSGGVQTIAPIHFMAQATVCLPFLFIVTRWFLDRPSWPRTAILASTYAMASLASFPPILLPSFVFTVLYFCCAIVVEKRSSWRQCALRYLIGTGLSLGIVAVYYAPTILTIRSTGHATAAYQNAGLEFLPLRAVFDLLSPTANGGAGIYLSPVMGGLSGGLKYVGVTALLLALFSIARTNRRVATLVLTCGGGAILVLLKICGVRPVQWLGLLPGFQNIHYAHYLGIPLAFLVSVLSGVGLDHLRRKAVSSWLLALAAVVLAALLTSMWLFMRGAGNFNQPEAWRWVAGFRFAGLLALAAAFASVLAYLGRGRIWGRAAGWTLLALVLFEGASNATYPRQRRWDAFTHPPAYVSFLQNMPPRSRGFEVEVFRANSGSAFGIDQLDSLYAFFSSRMYELYTNYVGSTDPLFMRGGSKIPPEAVLDRAGINWVLINPFLPAMLSELGARNYPVIFDQNGLKIFSRDTAQRQIFSSEYEVMDRAAALQSIAIAPSRILVLEAQPPFPPAPNHVDDPTPEIVSAKLNSLEFRVRAPRPGLLYVSDAWAQGWSATVNGDAAPIFIANYAFRAVPIPAGDVRVRFSYLPVGFIPGLAVSVVSIGIVLLFGIPSVTPTSK